MSHCPIQTISPAENARIGCLLAILEIAINNAVQIL
jgi:hypothetical protein